MKLASYLKQAFPRSENKWRLIVLISLFVTFFLLVFQPFGLVHIEKGWDKSFFIGGFGLVTFAVLLIDLVVIEQVFSTFFEEKNWRVWKELLWLAVVIFTIGLGNVLYISFFAFGEQVIDLDFIINFQLITFAVALFPITAFTMVKHNYLKRMYINSAQDVNQLLGGGNEKSNMGKSLCLYAYNQKKKVEFAVNDFCFIESKGNDIDVYIYEDDLLVKKTLRNTLKKALTQLDDFSEIVQCHRAFIVNMKNVKHVEGNSQGLLLKVACCDMEIPVSRNFVSVIKGRVR